MEAPGRASHWRIVLSPLPDMRYRPSAENARLVTHLERSVAVDSDLIPQPRDFEVVGRGSHLGSAWRKIKALNLSVDPQGRLANLASCCINEKQIPVETSGSNCVSCAVERNVLDAPASATVPLRASVDQHFAQNVFSGLSFNEKELAFRTACYNDVATL